jgi:Protein of unknown function (DUF2384)
MPIVLASIQRRLWCADSRFLLQQQNWYIISAEMKEACLSARSLTNPAAAADTLSKAVIRAAQLLGVKQTQLASILGISTATASRLVAGEYKLQPNRKEWEFGSLFVRLFRSLDALLGHSEQAHKWLNSRNLALGEVPAELLGSTEGLVRVLHYLDAYRGRI